MAIFSIQDLVKDPPFTKLDLLSCRNLLIYLDAELHKRLVPHSIMPYGRMDPGNSETIAGYVDLFAQRSRRWRIFKRRDSRSMRLEQACLFPLARHATRQSRELLGCNAPLAATHFSQSRKSRC